MQRLHCPICDVGFQFDVITGQRFISQMVECPVCDNVFRVRYDKKHNPKITTPTFHPDEDEIQIAVKFYLSPFSEPISKEEKLILIQVLHHILECPKCAQGINKHLG